MAKSTQSPASKAKQQRLASMRENIARQVDILKQKRKDLSNYIKNAKISNKGKGLQPQMQSDLIINSKRQDIFRVKQRVDSLKLQMATERAKKVY